MKLNLGVEDVDGAGEVAGLGVLSHVQISTNQISAKGTNKRAQVQNALNDSAMTRKVRVLVETKQQYVHVKPGTFFE